MRLVLDARTASFAALIDYAGLFPPASLDMTEATATYRAVRGSRARWVAGRFLCPASRLEELAGVMMATFVSGEEPWEIGVILDENAGQAASHAQTFHAEMQPAAVVASAEGRPGSTDLTDIEMLVDTITSIQPETVAFVEVVTSEPIGPQVQTVAATLADRGRVGGVKLRCGGLTADRFPDPGTVAEFIYAATSARTPFKATAGLHQPIRHHDATLNVWRHGFINILVAAAAADAGHGVGVLTQILSDDDPDAFAISTAFVTWREITIPGPAMRRVRTQGFVGYGSCEFFEPVEALENLSFLGEGT